MNGVPLHPALVHVPLGLAFVVPLVALGLAWALWAGHLPRRAWVVAVVLQAVMLGGALVALRTGEAEEERVERIVGDAAIKRHEEAAQQFTVAVGVTLVLAFAPLFARGVALRAALVAAALASVAVAGLAIRVGHAGGELVYVHGAASAHAGGPSGARRGEPPAGTPDAADDDEDGRRGRGRGGR